MVKENFEKKLAQLEKIVADLESGNLSLESSLDEYKKGIELIKSCNKIIEQAEEEVNRLTKEFTSDE